MMYWATLKIPGNETIKVEGGRRSSVVSSVSTIMQQWVRIPSTPVKLFSIGIIEIVMRKAQKKQKEAGIGPFLKKQ